MNDKLKNIKCKLHNDKDIDNLSIDPSTFNIICLKCDNMNLSSKENLYYDNTANDHYKPCYKHINEEGLFYCDDCSRFVCKICFATIHKSHTCSTIDLIVSDIKHDLTKLHTTYKVLQSQLEQSTNQAELMNKIAYLPKHNFQVKIDGIIQSINNALKENKECLIAAIQASFDNITIDNDSNNNSLVSSNEFYNELKELIDYITEPLTTDINVCLFKHSNGKEIYDRYQSVMLQLKKIKEIVSIADILGNLYQAKRKMILSYEQSLIHSIKSRLPNNTLKLKRFNHYTPCNSKHFKIDSLCFITTHSLYLKAIGICGLFLVPREAKCINNYNIKLSIYKVEDVNAFDMNDNSPLASNDVSIPIITNTIDPIYQCYLKEPIAIEKETLYYIIIANNSKVSFINTWTGSVSKERDENINQHSVMCNNSSVKFNFINTHGVNSDINEFSHGIISTIYFNPID